MPSADILHADVDAFYASVAQRDDPALRGRPVAVGSWVVMAASYEARAFGVRGGMRGVDARRRCPNLVTVDTDFEAYREASKAVFEIFRRATPVVEAGSQEEAFLDLRGTESEPRAVAERLRREVRAEVGLPLSVGVARTKVLAKIASRCAKPDGLLVVPPDEEEAFLHPLPVDRLYGVGPATARRLRTYGIDTVGSAAQLSEAELMTIAGKAAGRYVHAVVQRHESRGVRRRRGRRGFGAQRALGRGPRTRADLDETLAMLVERVTKRMVKSGRAGRTITLRLRFGDMTRASRSTTLAQATVAADTLLAAARGLLDASEPLIAERGISLLGITISSLDGAGSAHQLALPLDGDASEVP